MRQWIRWWGLGVFLFIVLVIWLGTNPLIKWSIESAGTRAVGAEVELDSVSFSFSRATLELNSLQVTNPDEPMRNSVEVGRIEFALNGYALLRRQFVAENMAVEGLRFNTERERSGEIVRDSSEDRRSEADGQGFDLSRLLPGMDLPDPSAIAAEESERLQGRVGELEQEAAEIEQDWEDRIEELPDSDAMDGYRARLDEIEDMDRLRQAAAVRELRDDISDDLDRVRSLRRSLESDRDRVREITARVRAMPGEEAGRLIAGTGLDEGFGGVARQLLGEKLNNWVLLGLGGYELASRHLAGREAEDEKARPPRGEGETIRFPEEEPLPGFLIKRAALDGVFRLVGREIDFDGRMENITHQPAIWGRPMTLTIDGRGEGGAELAVNGTFDHRESPSRDELSFRLDRFTLTDATISDSSRLPVVLEHGLADFQGNLVVTEGRLDSSVNARFTEASFDTGAGDSGDVVDRLARAIEGVSAFRMDLDLDGTLSSPEIRLRSDLDNIIGNAIGDEARHELTQARAELEQELQAELAPQLDTLAAHQRQLEAYEERIEERREALRNLRP